MKRTFSLLLILLLCLVLAACQSGEEAASGQMDSEAAAETTVNTEPSEVVDENEYLHGSWVNMYDDTVYTFAPGGAGTAGNEAFTYTVEGDTLTIPGEEEPIALSIVEEDGIHRIFNTLSRIYLVPETSAEALAPVTLEITMDNWEEYFEFRVYGCDGYKPNFPDEGIPACGAFLKEEYKQKLVDTPVEGDDKLSVAFTFGYDVTSFSYTMDNEGNPTFVFSDNIPYDLRSSIPALREQPLKDYRTRPGMEFEGFVEPIVAEEYWYSGSEHGNSGSYAHMKNPYVADVHGTLTFLP